MLVAIDMPVTEAIERCRYRHSAWRVSTGTQGASSHGPHNFGWSLAFLHFSYA